MRIVAFGLVSAAILAFTFMKIAPLVKGNEADFDYYVLSLSWSPNWCKLEGDEKGSEQCAPNNDYGWILHGLWPQYEKGWPSECSTFNRKPPQKLTESMAEIMGSTGLPAYQWKKHGTCSGLSPKDYFAASRQAFDSIAKPPSLREIKETISLPAKAVEDVFLASNPQLTADQITITCKRNHIQEARICLDKGLEPRRCGEDVIRDCRHEDAGFAPIR